MEDKIKRTNSALIKAMDEMKSDENSKTRSVFIQELLNAKLIIPSVVTPEPVDGKITPGSQISFFSVKTKDKENMLFMFSSIDELKKWENAQGKQLILQNYEQFKRFVVGDDAKYDGLVIDPYGANIAIRRGLIEKIDTVVKPMQVKNEKITVEEGGLQPAEFASPGLYAALSDTMVRHEAVNSAWLMQAQKTGDKKPTIVLVVDVKGADTKTTFNALARVAREFFAPGESFGIMSAYDRAAMASVKFVQPFYVKNVYRVESKQ